MHPFVLDSLYGHLEEKEKKKRKDKQIKIWKSFKPNPTSSRTFHSLTVPCSTKHQALCKTDVPIA